MTTADARDIPLNELDGPADGLGYPSHLTDCTALTLDLIDTHFTFADSADVKLVIRGPAQFDPSHNVSTGTLVFWYAAVPGMDAPTAALGLPYVMRAPGTTRMQRGKKMATFLIFKHLSLRCTACLKLGHAALAPTCHLSPNTIMGRQHDPARRPGRRPRDEERDPNMALVRNVRARVA